MGFEWDPELEEEIDVFLEKGDFNFSSISDEYDGRITAGHFALLKKLKDERLLDNFFFFDPKQWPGSWDLRDQRMADNVLAKKYDRPTLIVSGRLHAKTEQVDVREGRCHPMGENLKNKIFNILTAEIVPLSGQCFNCELKDFEFIKKTDKNIFYKKDTNSYILELSEAHPAVVPKDV